MTNIIVEVLVLLACIQYLDISGVQEKLIWLAYIFMKFFAFLLASLFNSFFIPARSPLKKLNENG